MNDDRSHESTAPRQIVASRPAGEGLPLLGSMIDSLSMIEVRNLTKKFGGFTAVDNISFEINNGEIFAFLDQNGDVQGFQSINFLVLPLFLLSGALFPFQGTPEAVAIFARLDPLTYGVDALRTLLTSTGYIGLGTDAAVLGAITLVCLWLGSYFFKKIQA